jgi:uncharacterized membrane protein YadS
MLVPVVLAITYLLFRGPDRTGTRPPFPLFLVAFILLVSINSVGLIPAFLGELLADVSRWALVAAIAALGVRTSLGDLAAVGPRALLLLLAETVWIALVCLAVLGLTG